DVTDAHDISYAEPVAHGHADADYNARAHSETAALDDAAADRIHHAHAFTHSVADAAAASERSPDIDFPAHDAEPAADPVSRALSRRRRTGTRPLALRSIRPPIPA